MKFVCVCIGSYESRNLYANGPQWNNLHTSHCSTSGIGDMGFSLMSLWWQRSTHAHNAKWTIYPAQLVSASTQEYSTTTKNMAIVHFWQHGLAKMQYKYIRNLPTDKFIVTAAIIFCCVPAILVFIAFCIAFCQHWRMQESQFKFCCFICWLNLLKAKLIIKTTKKTRCLAHSSWPDSINGYSSECFIFLWAQSWILEKPKITYWFRAAEQKKNVSVRSAWWTSTVYLYNLPAGEKKLTICKLLTANRNNNETMKRRKPKMRPFFFFVFLLLSDTSKVCTWSFFCSLLQRKFASLQVKVCGSVHTICIIGLCTYASYC